MTTPDDGGTTEREDELPTVSVVIPVFNDAERLRTCLRAIARQTYPADRVDVVVVDNASTEDLRPALPQDSRFRMVGETRRGSYAARNAGVAVATGEVLAFTDADCIPRPDWLSEAVAALRRPSTDAVGGLIHLLFRSGDGPFTGPELYEAKHDFLQHKYVEEWSFAATANLVVGAETFHRVGPFNSDLLSGGDLDWGTRLGQSGGRLVYSARAVVDHPSRPTWGELATKSLRVANGLSDRAEGTARTQLLRTAMRQARGGVTIWVKVWRETVPSGGLAKARYAAAFSFVRLLRTGVQMRRLATARPARSAARPSGSRRQR